MASNKMLSRSVVFTAFICGTGEDGIGLSSRPALQFGSSQDSAGISIFLDNRSGAKRNDEAMGKHKIGKSIDEASDANSSDNELMEFVTCDGKLKSALGQLLPRLGWDAAVAALKRDGFLGTDERIKSQVDVKEWFDKQTAHTQRMVLPMLVLEKQFRCCNPPWLQSQYSKEWDKKTPNPQRRELLQKITKITSTSAINRKSKAIQKPPRSSPPARQQKQRQEEAEESPCIPPTWVVEDSTHYVKSNKSTKQTREQQHKEYSEKWFEVLDGKSLTVDEEKVKQFQLNVVQLDWRKRNAVWLSTSIKTPTTEQIASEKLGSSLKTFFEEKGAVDSYHIKQKYGKEAIYIHRQQGETYLYTSKAYEEKYRWAKMT